MRLQKITIYRHLGFKRTDHVKNIDLTRNRHKVTFSVMYNTHEDSVATWINVCKWERITALETIIILKKKIEQPKKVFKRIYCKISVLWPLYSKCCQCWTTIDYRVNDKRTEISCSYKILVHESLEKSNVYKSVSWMFYVRRKISLDTIQMNQQRIKATRFSA